MVAEQAVQLTRSSRPYRLNAQIALQNLRSRLDLMRRSLVNDMAVVDYVNPIRQLQRCRQILFHKHDSLPRGGEIATGLYQSAHDHRRRRIAGTPAARWRTEVRGEI